MKNLYPVSLLLAFVLIAACSKQTGKVAMTQTAFEDPPKWAKEAIWYQIYADRFRNGDPSNDPKVEDLKGAYWEISMQWWSGETLGNWWDGYVRTAFLTKNKAAMKRSKEIVEYMMSTQDEDGYFGIYGPAMRYQHPGSNGELWTKTTVLRMMLGYHEMSGDERVLNFVEKAMENTMEHYNKGKKSPFNVDVEYGGVTHGLMMTDVCEMLYRITGKQLYSDYALFCMKIFLNTPSTGFQRCLLWLSHGERLPLSEPFGSYVRAPSIGDPNLLCHRLPEMKEAYQSALNKLSNCILPSGAGFGNEWLNKEIAKPDRTGAEVCGINELKDFYLSALQKSGDASFGDAAEKITFNGLMGARNQDGKGITYCKTDNCFILNRKSPQSDFEEADPRYKYSPTHADAAVCCNPSYAKYYPYFVSSIWMKAEDGLVAALYGPSSLKTEWGGAEIEIRQRTHYPFSDRIELEITTSEPVECAIYFRKPAWANGMKLSGKASKAVLENGFYKLTAKWQSGDKIDILFDNKVLAKEYHNGELYFQRGPLVYAYEVPHKTENVKEYKVSGFHDYYCFATEHHYDKVALSKEAASEFNFVSGEPSIGNDPWQQPANFLEGEILNTETNKSEKVKLVPMGGTVLRRVTFQLSK